MDPNIMDQNVRYGTGYDQVRAPEHGLRYRYRVLLQLTTKAHAVAEKSVRTITGTGTYLNNVGKQP
jgi:hypothetical protein